MLCVAAATTPRPSSSFPLIDAPNLWQVPVAPAAIAKAHRIFENALMPRLVEDQLVAELGQRLIGCELLDTDEGKFFAMRGGSSTNEKLMDSSDLSWISVDDEATFNVFANLFEEMGIANALAPVIDLDDTVRLYSCFYVVRSRCSAANWHTDWPDAVGTNAFTLLSPIEEYETDDFQLLYEDSQGVQKQYKYRLGEAICFSSRFVHSTEPGHAIPEQDGSVRPHVFLCFTFGSGARASIFISPGGQFIPQSCLASLIPHPSLRHSSRRLDPVYRIACAPDKAEHWPVIAPTIDGYQSRFLRRYDGVSQLTQIGEYLDGETEEQVQQRKAHR